jgi:4a-hydroxytetrahydrobiopterin dehydratase
MWNEEEQHLVKEFVFKDFLTAFAFMSEVAKEAEQQQHHPTWTNTYNKVLIQLQTHDAGNIVTSKDTELASVIDQIAQRFLH